MFPVVVGALTAPGTVAPALAVMLVAWLLVMNVLTKNAIDLWAGSLLFVWLFGWNQIAEPNLANAAGLPASPFRTDKWSDATNPLAVVPAPGAKK